jgi:hypothetical protein
MAKRLMARMRSLFATAIEAPIVKTKDNLVSELITQKYIIVNKKIDQR